MDSITEERQKKIDLCFAEIVLYLDSIVYGLLQTAIITVLDVLN